MLGIWGCEEQRLTEISQENWFVARKHPHKDTGKAKNMGLRSFWIQAGPEPVPWRLCYAFGLASLLHPFLSLHNSGVHRTHRAMLVLLTSFCRSGPTASHRSLSSSWSPHPGEKSRGPHHEVHLTIRPAAGKQAALGHPCSLVQPARDPGPEVTVTWPLSAVTGGAIPGVLR